MAEEMQDVWKQVSINQAPSRSSVPSPTLLPHATQSDLTNGRKIPPALADTDGMAGASKASLKTKLYPNPNDELPKSRTNWYAMRLPSPVLMKPLAKKKASAMSHGIGSPKAEKAAAKVRVFVSTEAPRPRSATAPSGSGCVMMPTMVARKIASSCHAFLETPAGSGTNHRMTPVATAAAIGFSAAPCHGGLGLEVTAVDEEARTTVFSFLATRFVSEIGEGSRRGLVAVVNELC